MPGLSIAVLVVMIGVLIWFERADRRDRKAAAQWQTLSKVSAVLGEILHEHTKLEDDRRIPPVRVDPGQIDQVIVNLVVNSAYALPDGGTISLTTGTIEIPRSHNLRPYVLPGRYVSLVVKDNGSGMDEGTRGLAFEPFFTTIPVGKGTGLGLSTVYGIIKQSGGYVWIDSEIGAGTAVTMCFEAASHGV